MTDHIMTARNEPFKSEAACKRSLPDGYTAVEDGNGGWIGIKDKALDVICPQCGQSYHETTSAYDPERFANASMLTLKTKYREWGWEDLGSDPHSGYGCLVCPDCGGALAPSGRLRVKR